MSDWLVVATKPMSEELAARALVGGGWRVYLPRMRKVLLGVRLGADGRRIRCRGHGEVVLRPLFRGYLFAAFEEGCGWGEIGRTRGVMRVVGSRDEEGIWRPGLVDGEIVELVRESERGGEFDDVRGARKDLALGASVRVAELNDLLGRVVGLLSGGRAVVDLEMLGRRVRATVSVDGLLAAEG